MINSSTLAKDGRLFLNNESNLLTEYENVVYFKYDSGVEIWQTKK